MTGLAVGLALLASFGYGTGSVLVRSAVRNNTASSVAVWVQAVGFLSLVVGLAVVRPEFSWEAVLWGLSAGVLAACGVLMFYTALQNGPVSVVAPVSATGVVVPVVGGLFLGEHVSGLALIGLALILLGVIIIARSHSTPVVMLAEHTDGGITHFVTPPGRSQVAPIHDNCKPAGFRRPQLVAAVLSVVSALSFGVFYLVLRESTAAAVESTQDVSAGVKANYPFGSALLVAVAVQSGSLIVTLALALRHTVTCVRPSQKLVMFALAIGLLDVVGDLALTYAIAVGPVSLVGPLGSLDPIVAVLLASLLFRERLTVQRLAGLGACAIGIALVAV